MLHFLPNKDMGFFFPTHVATKQATPCVVPPRNLRSVDPPRPAIFCKQCLSIIYTHPEMDPSPDIRLCFMHMKYGYHLIVSRMMDDSSVLILASCWCSSPEPSYFDVRMDSAPLIYRETGTDTYFIIPQTVDKTRVVSLTIPPGPFTQDTVMVVGDADVGRHSNDITIVRNRIKPWYASVGTPTPKDVADLNWLARGHMVMLHFLFHGSKATRAAATKSKKRKREAVDQAPPRLAFTTEGARDPAAWAVNRMVGTKPLPFTLVAYVLGFV